VHRIGRTGRNGADGIAVTLCAPDEVKKLRAVERITRTELLAPQPGRAPQAQVARKPAPPQDPARAQRARVRRPRRTQRAA
jgi:ATP-dependent RNA helicase RhlE